MLPKVHYLKKHLGREVLEGNCFCVLSVVYEDQAGVIKEFHSFI